MGWIEDQLKKLAGLAGIGTANPGPFGFNNFGMFNNNPTNPPTSKTPTSTPKFDSPILETTTIFKPKKQPVPPVLPQVQPDDDLTAIYKQLLANLSTGGTTTGGFLSKADINKQVASKYDPQINRIKREMGIAKERYKFNRDEIKALYDELERDYLSSRDSTMAEYSQDSAEETARNAAIQSRMQGNYQDIYSDMGSEFSTLGIESALNPASQQLRDDLSYMDAVADTDSAAAQQLISAQGTANQNFFNQNAALANERGAEVTTDFLRDLEDYMTLREGDITDLHSARASDISALMAQIAQAKAQQQSQQQTDMWNRLLQLGNFGMDLRKLQMTNQQAQAPQVYDSGLLGASQWLEKTVGAQRAPQLMGLLQQVLQNQQVREGRFETPNGDIVNITPEQVVKMAMDAAAKQGIPDAEKVALMNAIYAYYGRLK